MPVHKNRINEIPFIVTTDSALWCYSRDHFLDGTIKAYWGPGQPPTYDQDSYSPPTKWPKAGTLLSIPKTARFIWQTADLDAEAVLLGGFSGSYSYGTHENEHSYDADTPPGVFPVHSHFTYPWQTGDFVDYAIPVEVHYTGHLDVPNGAFDVTGFDRIYYGLKFAIPPFSLVDYHLPNSVTARAIQFTYDINESPDQSHTSINPFFIPPITTTSNGPAASGTTDVLLTGNYYIDGITYSTGDGFIYGPSAVDVHLGYKPPVVKDVAKQFENWAKVSDNIQKFYEKSTTPYVDCYLMQLYTNAFAQMFTPYDLPYLGCESVHVVVLSKPYPVFDFPDEVARIKKAFKYLKKYKVYVFYDLEYMIDCYIPAAVIGGFVDKLSSLCSSLASCGWEFRGPVGYTTASEMEETFKGIISENFPEDESN